MTIKTFKRFFAENDAKDYIAPKDSDDEVKDIKPRSKGEVDFQKSHKMTHTKHPVAGDHQFDGSIKGINEEAELNEFFTRDQIKTAVEITRNTSDKKKALSQIEKVEKGLSKERVVAVALKQMKEEVDEAVIIEEDAWSDLQTIVKTLASKNSSGKVKFANGKQETVDMGTAKQIVTTLNKLNPNNKKKAIATLNKDPAGLMKVLDIVHKA
jgi:hypothetical protein